MIRFILRMAKRAATVKRSRFLGLTLTIAAASSLLVILSSLYFNAESQLSLDLSGVPNMIVEPKSTLMTTAELSPSDVNALKSEAHFWRNNVHTATPVLKSEGTYNENPVPLAGTWFTRDFTVQDESYTFGLLTFSGWDYSGHAPSENEVIHTFQVAGRIETGSYWDDYVFMDLSKLGTILDRDNIDEILVSSLIKPKDELALEVEQYGEDALTLEEFEMWYCSPYTSSIAYTIQEVLPDANVRILRRVTEVQEGVIKASTGVFLALFVLTLAAAITAIFSAEKMYVTSHIKDFGIMAAIGGSQQKILLQVVVELVFASVLSGLLAYGISAGLLNIISNLIFQIDSQSQGTLIVASLVIPFITAFLALFFVRKGFSRDVVELLRS